MKLKHLEEALQQVRGFENPSVELEQVITSPHLASHMIYAAHQNEDIEGILIFINASYPVLANLSEGMAIGDFGCGTGMLSIASSLMGCAFSIGFDVDIKALAIAQQNLSDFELNNCELVQSDVQSLALSSSLDVVVSNPPFGTRNRGIDSAFVDQAMKNAAVVYSLHKSSTREHFVRRAADAGWKMQVVAELRYDLPKVHKFHKQKSKDIEVDLYRFTHVA